MKKSKFNILFQEVISSLNSNKLDQQYFNDCNTLQHDKPIKFQDSWIQIFIKYSGDGKCTTYNKPYYFSYILDDYGVVKKYLSQVFLNKNDCLEAAQFVVSTNEQLPQKHFARLQKSIRKFMHKPHTRKYDFIDLLAQDEFSIHDQDIEKFIQLLNQSDLVQEWKPKYNDLLHKTCGTKTECEDLIEENYLHIDIEIIKSTSLPFGMHQILFRLILPYTQLNWFNKIFRESLETIRQNEI